MQLENNRLDVRASQAARPLHVSLRSPFGGSLTLGYNPKVKATKKAI